MIMVMRKFILTPQQRLFNYTGQYQKNMQRLLCMVLLAIFFAGIPGCKKSPLEEETDVPVSVTGKWYYTAYFYSIGGPLIWQPVTTPNQYISLAANGNFSSNFSPFNTAKTYQFTDSTHIKIIPQGGQNPLLYFFKLDSINNALLLSPANPMCIEGCGQKFSR